VPNIFGMNFQAVSVGQKLVEKIAATGGYADAMGTPTEALLGEIKVCLLRGTSDETDSRR
jgi:hypothetical protein